MGWQPPDWTLLQKTYNHVIFCKLYRFCNEYLMSCLDFCILKSYQSMHDGRTLNYSTISWPGIYDWPAGSNYPHTWSPCPMLGITFWIYKAKCWERYQFNSTFFSLSCTGEKRILYSTNSVVISSGFIWYILAKDTLKVSFLKILVADCKSETSTWSVPSNQYLQFLGNNIYFLLR